MNDRFKFRRPVFRENKFVGFDILEITDSLYPTARTELAHLCGGYMAGDTIRGWEQCTGLKDKNGNLIYEGDIIHDLGEIEPVCSLPLVVRWSGRTAGFYLDHQKIGMRASLGRLDSADSHNYEIIGNIHEQAEQKDK